MSFFDLMSNYINPAFWVLANLAVVWAMFIVVIYWVLYSILFRWYQLEGGQLIWKLVTFIVGLVALSIIGLFVDPVRPWYIAPDDVLWWRPALRLAIYLLGSVTVTQMLISIVRRAITRQPLLIDVSSRRQNSPTPK